MKVIAGIFVIFVAVSTIAATDSSESGEIEKMIEEQAIACQKELKATDQQMKDLMDAVEPKTQTDKCLHACLMNKLGIMDGSNKLVPNKLSQMIMDDKIKTKDGKPLKSFIADIAEACKSVSDPDKCESAVKIMTCFNAEAKKLGFEKDVL